MRAGYTVWSDVSKEDRFILVSNYQGTNQVSNIGCLNTQELKHLIDCNDIGFWRLKPKKSIAKK